jgi:prepilin-type N-terminal cleavage/methylation domain-containing protein
MPSLKAERYRQAVIPAGPPRQHGFTLVEALVVAVIIGVLAAVAIPSYSNYVQNQKKAMALGIAQSGATAANIYYRRTGTPPPDSASLKLFLSEPARYKVQVAGDSIFVTDVSDASNPLKAAVKYK